MKKQKSNIKQILPLAALLLILTISFYALSATGAGKGSFSQTTSNGKSLPSPVADSAEELDLNVCGLSSVDCSFERKNTYMAWATKYSRADSCHNRKGNKCLTAIGQDTQAGITVACPRQLKLGAKVRILDHIYTCHDRYAQWVDEKFILPTFDIFTEDYNEAINFGRKKVIVEIL